MVKETVDPQAAHKAGFTEAIKVERVGVVKRKPCDCSEPRIDPYAGYSDVGDVCHRASATHARCTRCAGRCLF